MRKRIGACVLAVLMAAALAVPAAAAKPENTETNPGIYDLSVNNGYTVTPQNADGANVAATEAGFYANAEKLAVTVPATVAASGSYNLIFARSGDANDPPTEDNLVYIDQDTATASGVTFTVYPSELKPDVTYYILLSNKDNAKVEVAHFNYYLPYTLGDVDGNGSILPSDALLALQEYAQISNPRLNAVQLLAADMDGNGNITPNDALLILKAYAGN